MGDDFTERVVTRRDIRDPDSRKKMAVDPYNGSFLLAKSQFKRHGLIRPSISLETSMKRFDFAFLNFNEPANRVYRLHNASRALFYNFQ